MLQIIWTNPEDLVKVHPSMLKNLGAAGLTLIKHRAIYGHIKEIELQWRVMQVDNDGRQMDLVHNDGDGRQMDLVQNNEREC
jgi:hypothetical protein